MTAGANVDAADPRPHTAGTRAPVAPGPTMNVRLLVLWAICGGFAAACTTAPSGGAAATTDTVAADAGATGDTAGNAETAAADASGKDAATTDAPAQAETAPVADVPATADSGKGGDAAPPLDGPPPADGPPPGDAPLPPKDGGPPPDGPPPPMDGGPAPDAPPPPKDLAEICAFGCTLQAVCPNADAIGKCTDECVGGLSAYPTCVPLLGTLYKCIDPKSITCDSNGKAAKPTTCATELKALEDCIKGGPAPGSCSVGPCYAGGGSGGQVTCGCSKTCPYPPGEWKIDCDGNQCTCTIGGKAQPPIPASNSCANPQDLLKTLCGAP